MKDFIVKYGTFLILPLVIALISFILCHLSANIKSPVTMFVCAKNHGVVYMSKDVYHAIIPKDTITLTCANGQIKCKVTKVEEETDKLRLRVAFDADTLCLNDNTLCNAYIVRGKIPMYELVFQKLSIAK